MENNLTLYTAIFGVLATLVINYKDKVINLITKVKQFYLNKKESLPNGIKEELDNIEEKLK
jgi:hypothetical protein